MNLIYPELNSFEEKAASLQQTRRWFLCYLSHQLLMGGGALVGRTTQANLGTNFILGFVFIYSYIEWICSKDMISLTLSWWWWWLALLVVTGQWHDGGSDRAPPTPQSDCLTRVQIASDSNLRDNPHKSYPAPPTNLIDTDSDLCSTPLHLICC